VGVFRILHNVNRYVHERRYIAEIMLQILKLINSQELLLSRGVRPLLLIFATFKFFSCKTIEANRTKPDMNVADPLWKCPCKNYIYTFYNKHIDI